MKLKTIRLRSPHHRRRKGRATSLRNILTGKWGKQHRLPAHVTGEGDWEVEVPQIRMSRAFAVMLVLHIVAVGGLFAFRIWGRDDDKKDTATAVKTESSRSIVEPASLVTSPSAGELPPPSESVPEPLKTYTWHAGDTLQLVAARFNVSGNTLREANPGKELVAGAEIVVPKPRRIIGGADVENPTGQGAAIFDPEKDLAATPRPPKAEVISEGPVDAGIPDVVPPPAHETAAPVVKNVSAQATAKTAPAKSTKPETGSTKSSKPKTEVASSKNNSKPEGVFSKPSAKAEQRSSKPPKAEVVSSKSKSQDQPSKPKPKASDDTPARSGGQRVHVVSKGDTVFNVAKRFGFTAAEVAKANGLGSEYRIQLGQQLRIPVRR